MSCSSEAGTAHSTVRMQTVSQTLQLVNVNNPLLEYTSFVSVPKARRRGCLGAKPYFIVFD